MDIAAPRTYIIDTRELSAYQCGHPRGAFHFPWSSIDLLACGLPDRDCALEIICSLEESKAVLDFFGRLQFHTVLLRSIEEYDEITQESPRGFSFQPNQYLSSRIELVESNLGGPGVALDVGCGSGRDMVYLAARGWLVVGVENRLRLLNCAKALAAKNCAAHRVNSLLWDVRKGSGVVRPGSYQLLHVCRFIHRPSLPRFVKGLAKGGYVIYSHFLEGCENTAIGHPKNSSGFFLHGELQSLLVSCGVMLLHVEECLLHDDRPMIHIVGKKL